jgi:hypothetical protein
VALGGKLWTIQLGATNIPFWDQWDEAKLFFKPWLEGTLTWHDFFRAHNEHRIFFTRVLDLLEVKLNGQWDPNFQTVVNSVIHIAYGWFLAIIIWASIGRRYGGLICFALLPFFAFPFAAENSTHGFQSQMYFVSIFSVAAILGLGFGRPGSRIWLGGFAVGLMSVFTMASGFLAAVALIGLVILRALKARRLTGGQILTIFCGGLVIALGLALKVKVAKHDVLQAHSFHDFFTAFIGNLAWPFRGRPVMGPVLALPLIIVLVKYLRPGCRNARAAEFVLVFGLWAFLQTVALAFGRALLADSSRYYDAFSTLPMASVAALFVIAADYDFPQVRKKVALGLAILWSSILMFGLCHTSYVTAKNYLSWTRAWGLLETENVRAFIYSGNDGWLKSNMEAAIPYPESDTLIDLMRQPKILSIMPADARVPLKLELDEALSAGFSTNGCPPGKPGQPFVKTWGNSPTNGPAMAGHFVSRPMSTSLPKLSVQVYRGSPEVKIRLTETGGSPVELHPQFSDRWETLIVDAPRHPFVLSVENVAAGTPVALGEIKELGRFSVYAQNLIDHAVLILCIGLGLCTVLAVLAMLRPGVTLANEGLPWLLILLFTLPVLAAAICWHNFDGNTFSFGLQIDWAVRYASHGHPSRAELHLREALWLQQDNAQAQKELAILQAGPHEPLPEKNP